MTDESLVVSITETVPLIFRGPLLICIIWILWGINVLVFRLYHIEYEILLSLGPSSGLFKPRHIILQGVIALFVLLFFLKIYTSLISTSHAIALAMVLHAFIFFWMISPFGRLKRGRYMLLSNLAKVFCPAQPGVSFVEVLIGDIMTSVSKVFGDLAITLLVFNAVLMEQMQQVEFNSDLVELSEKSGFYKSNDIEHYTGVFDVNEGFFNILRRASLYEYVVVLRPLFCSLPFLLRFRQCIVQYRIDGDFKNILNSIKYLSALPVLIISALVQVMKDSESPLNNISLLKYLNENVYVETMDFFWIVSVSINSMYSFMWDIIMDWGLCREDSPWALLRPTLLFAKIPEKINAQFPAASSLGRAGATDSFNVLKMSPMISTRFFGKGSPSVGGLNSLRNFSSFFTEKSVRDSFVGVNHALQNAANCGFGPLLYYFAMAFDFVFRILWSLKLSSYYNLSVEGKTFLFEICEVLRRFVWIFLRVEWEKIKTSNDLINLRVGLGEDDIEGGEISNLEALSIRKKDVDSFSLMEEQLSRLLEEKGEPSQKTGYDNSSRNSLQHTSKFKRKNPRISILEES